MGIAARLTAGVVLYMLTSGTVVAQEVAAGDTTGASVGLPSPDSRELGRRAYVAARLLSAMQLYFVHWQDTPELDLDREFKAYVDEAMGAPDRLGFALATMAFLAQFNNQHTWYFDRVVINGGHHDYEARFLDGEWVVVRSTRADLVPGDVIAAIDDQPFEAFYRQQSRYIAASTERNRRSLFFRSWWRGLFPQRYSLTLADGRQVSLVRTGEAELRDAEVDGYWIEPDRIAYIRIPSWDGSQFHEDALAYLAQFRDATGLVIDVRGNGGGRTPESFISDLMDRPWRWWQESTTLHLGVYSYLANEGYSDLAGLARPEMSWRSTTREPNGRFAGRLAILIDEGCASACEDFVMPFKDNGRAVLIGEATAGSSGQPYSARLDDGTQFFVGAKREYFPDGSAFEGVGVEPDVRKIPSSAELRSGQDTVLQTAIEAVRSAGR